MFSEWSQIFFANFNYGKKWVQTETETRTRRLPSTCAKCSSGTLCLFIITPRLLARLKLLLCSVCCSSNIINANSRVPIQYIQYLQLLKFIWRRENLEKLETEETSTKKGERIVLWKYCVIVTDDKCHWVFSGAFINNIFISFHV